MDKELFESTSMYEEYSDQLIEDILKSLAAYKKDNKYVHLNTAKNFLEFLIRHEIRTNKNIIIKESTKQKILNTRLSD